LAFLLRWSWPRSYRRSGSLWLGYELETKDKCTFLGELEKEE
jgi:hypothetical protein